MGRPPRRRCFAVLTLALSAIGLVTIFACNTPFIPIPPPDPTFAPVMITDGSGGMRTAWEARGGPSSALAETKVFVFNPEPIRRRKLNAEQFVRDLIDCRNSRFWQ